MSAHHAVETNKSTIVRTNPNARVMPGADVRDSHAGALRRPNPWLPKNRPQGRATDARPIDGQGTRAERMVAAALTLFLAGYAIAVAVRLFAAYGV